MNTAASASVEWSLVPSIVAETRLLRHFAGEAGAFLNESEGFFENERYFLAHVQSHDVAGFGRAPTKRMAFVKAVAEFYERRFMREIFSKEFSQVPKVLQTSNGFAVHFSQELASQAATNEAIERHLLQYSFLKDGWNGFELIQQKTVGEESLAFIASRYIVNNLRAGMVLATSKRFPGISFGYFVDKPSCIATSPRWSHAVSEALDKIEPFLKLALTSKTLDLMPIEQGILEWMMTPHGTIDFYKGGPIHHLPSPSIETTTFDLAQRWGLDLPFFGAYSYSKDLLPLLVMDRIKPEDTALISDILESAKLPRQLPERNPVL